MREPTEPTAAGAHLGLTAAGTTGATTQAQAVSTSSGYEFCDLQPGGYRVRTPHGGSGTLTVTPGGTTRWDAPIVAGESLPFTGFFATGLAALGSGLIVVGGLLLAVTCRRRRA